MFGQTIESILGKVEGATAALVVGMDGFIIEQRTIGGEVLALEAIAAEAAGFIRHLEGTFRNLNLGTLGESHFKTDRFFLLTQRITPDYFICLVMAADGNFGRGRFELRKAKSLLEKEFVV
ncbi:MAG: hypothetical protein PHX83_08430 [Acidobacteriia bacterium]|nr:hypothetical protein [Terriglobia bacterium]